MLEIASVHGFVNCALSFLMGQAHRIAIPALLQPTSEDLPSKVEGRRFVSLGLANPLDLHFPNSGGLLL
ncbi:unnamed protein product [Fusarium graminearum]|uniref:Uncharacterized protein n=1 Tax=Gibberella zeae TaxID=5518 RepID=A0A4U9EWR2_GIBZA|nr:unnamed protein product [Fusarium graminearum]CAF3474761.1 unnamed protein product [Fusarium graminearum]CAF3639611.1 unnamed protein product [Fusarium graminearum]CAG1960293.1 unnamed protein product [Fusarium graminearum]CAG1993160.1 unnamed protein product [Fusarium graminearum]